MRVGVDTSALMLPVQAGVRVFDELDRLLGPDHELVVPAAVVHELDALAQGNGKEATAAAVGRDLADRCTTVATEATYADDALVELAEGGRLDCVVTNDRPLRDRLPCKVIGLRGRNKLAFH